VGWQPRCCGREPRHESGTVRPGGAHSSPLRRRPSLPSLLRPSIHFVCALPAPSCWPPLRSVSRADRRRQDRAKKNKAKGPRTGKGGGGEQRERTRGKHEEGSALACTVCSCSTRPLVAPRAAFSPLASADSFRACELLQACLATCTFDVQHVRWMALVRRLSVVHHAFPVVVSALPTGLSSCSPSSLLLVQTLSRILAPLIN
jgi:hypothetical protein